MVTGVPTFIGGGDGERSMEGIPTLTGGGDGDRGAYLYSYVQ